MSKTIKLQRRELVWDVYETEYDAAEWLEILDYLKRSESEDNAIRYNAFKDLTFDEVCDIFSGEKEDVTYELTSTSTNWTWTESLTEYVSDCMRQDAWDYGAVDSYFADESDEEIHVEGNDSYTN